MPSKVCGLRSEWSVSEQLSASTSLSLKSAATLASHLSHSGRFINSVSDLYGTDEIDALLDEIRELEPLRSSTAAEDAQDFEIDGSISRLPFGSSNIMTCDSRTSVHSWDSHALYHHDTMEEDGGPVVGGPVSMYCDLHHLKTPIGILRLILIGTSLIGMMCLLSCGTEEYGVFSLPFVARIRLMLFIILFTTLVTCLLLFLDITLLYHAFPFHYHRWAIAIYTMECAAFMGSSALIVTLVQIYSEIYPWVQPWTKNFLIAASVFGFLGGCEALVLSIYGFFSLCSLHFPKRGPETDQLTLTERAAAAQESGRCSRTRKNSGSYSRHKNIPGPADEPPTTATLWPIDDVQPCSSKHCGTTSPTGLLNPHASS